MRIFEYALFQASIVLEGIVDVRRPLLLGHLGCGMWCRGGG